MDQKFYRIQNWEGIDVGRDCITQDGQGVMLLDGLGQNLKLVEKLPGELWGNAEELPEENHAS